MLGRLDRQARDAFLLSGCHTGLLSAAEAASELCRGGDRPALRRELAAGLAAAEPLPPALAKAAEVLPLPPPAEHGANPVHRRRKKPWDDWPPDDEPPDGSPPGATAPADAASRLLSSLLAAGRYEEALLSGCRMAAGGGRDAAWAETLGHARRVFRPGDRTASYVERLAEVATSAPWRGARDSPAFESALAAALAVCSGALPVRRGWRRSRERRDRYEEALNTVYRRSEAERRIEPPRAPERPRPSGHLTVVVGGAARFGRTLRTPPPTGLEPPRLGRALPCGHVSLLRRAEEPQVAEGQLPPRRQARPGPEDCRLPPRPAQRPDPRRLPCRPDRPG